MSAVPPPQPQPRQAPPAPVTVAPRTPAGRFAKPDVRRRADAAVVAEWMRRLGSTRTG